MIERCYVLIIQTRIEILREQNIKADYYWLALTDRKSRQSQGTNIISRHLGVLCYVDYARVCVCVCVCRMENIEYRPTLCRICTS